MRYRDERERGLLLLIQRFASERTIFFQIRRPGLCCLRKSLDDKPSLGNLSCNLIESGGGTGPLIPRQPLPV